LGFGFMAAAVLLGLYPVYRGGFVTLIIGLCGCAVIVAYSAGKKPISYRPFGEVVSGTVMGGLITMAVFSAFAGYVSWEAFFLFAPLIFGIGLIMMTNNICDIERDAPTGRRTLPVLLGRPRARVVYLCSAALWLLLIIVCVAARFRGGLLPVCLLLLAAFPVWRRLARLTLTPQRRGPCMGTIVLANLCANSAYVAAVLIHVYRGL
jgi:1,4-dihydroxy-2-naphthoate octaprenyltransferase